MKKIIKTLPMTFLICITLFINMSASAEEYNIIIDNSTIPLAQNTIIRITVKDEYSNLKDNIYVGLYGCGINQNTTTNSDGVAIFSLNPTSTGQINIDIESKGNTISETIQVTITGEPPNNKELTIENPSEINEGDEFSVIVKDNDTNSPINQANVSNEYLGQDITNNNGFVKFKAPQVIKDQKYTITVTAEGYTTKTSIIKVINSDKTPSLIISPKNLTVEINTTFSINISTLQEGPIPSATVIFNNRKYETSKKGSVNLLAPNKEGVYIIQASYQTYSGSQTNVKAIKIQNVKGTTEKKEIPKNTEFTINVTTEQGEPIKNAKVYIKNNPDIQTYTDENGKAKLTSPDTNEKFEVIVEKETSQGETYNDTLIITISSSSDIENNPKEKKSTDDGIPGFELIIVIFAISFIYLLKRKNKK